MQNRIKKTIICIIMVILCLSLFSCKNNDDDGETPTPPPADILELIGLDISGCVSKYEIGEELNISDLKAFAHYEDNTTKDVTEAIEIDTSKYNKEKDGTYEIIISYLENNILVKSFFFAVVGTGVNSDDNHGPIIDKNFGPGTYSFIGSDDLLEYLANQGLAENTQFAEGYYTLKGLNAKRANSETSYAIELPKEEAAWIEFEVTGDAVVTIECSSTGSSNTSVIAIYDSESSLVNNLSGTTDVSSTQITTLTYNLTSGYYRLLSPAGMSNSTRGVRVYSIVVVQE